MATAESSMTVTVRWSRKQPASQPCNQFAVHQSPNDEIVLTFGNVEPPIISGTAEEQKAQLADIVEHGLEVQSLVRLLLSMRTARELSQALANQIDAKGEG